MVSNISLFLPCLNLNKTLKFIYFLVSEKLADLL